MENVRFKIGQKVEIDDDNMVFKSNIQDISEDSLFIDVPVSGPKYFTMHMGKSFEFYTVVGKETYKYKTNVIGKKQDGNIRLIQIQMPTFIGIIQRRNFFRLPIIIDIKYMLLSEGMVNINANHLPDGYRDNMLKSFTVDISGGGMKIITHEHINKGRYLVVLVPIPDQIDLICSVVRCDYDKINRVYKLALKYEAIDERTRDKIVKFIFDKTREYNKLTKEYII